MRRIDSLMDRMEQLLADPTGAEHFIRHGESLVRRINDAFFDAKIPLSASLDRERREIVFQGIDIAEADRVVCRAEDIATIVSSKERMTSWP